MSSNSKTHRRSFLKAAGGAAATAAVAGCLGSNNSSSGNSSGSNNGSGGSGSSESGGTLTYARGAYPSNYDPQQSTSDEVGKITKQIFDNLITFIPGSGGKITSGLAKKFNLKGKRMTLKLRKGVKFHSGEEFTAADFKTTYRRYVDKSYQYYLGKDSISGNPSGTGPFTFSNWIESINIKGKHNLEIRLKHKYAPALRNLGMYNAAVLSKKQIEKLGKNQNQLGKNPKGTGPFLVKKLDVSNQRILLGKNDNYWGEGPYVNRVIIKTIKENSTRTQAVINGEAQIIDGVGTQGAKQLKSASSASLMQKQGLNVGYLMMNLARFKPFRKKKVRQAVNYAVNTKAIVNEIYEGFTTQADQPIPENMLGYNNSLSPYPTDKKKAKKLLKQAGETGLDFELATFSNPRGYNPSPVQTAQQVKSDLEDIGLHVKIHQFSTFSSYIQYIQTGKHDAAFIGLFSDNADPGQFYSLILDPGVDISKIPKDQNWVSFDMNGYNTFNGSAWVNRKFINLIRKGSKTYDESKRENTYKQAGKIVHEEAVCVFIDHAKILRGVNKKVDKSTYHVSSLGKPHLATVKLNGSSR